MRRYSLKFAVDRIVLRSLPIQDMHKNIICMNNYNLQTTKPLHRHSCFSVTLLKLSRDGSFSFAPFPERTKFPGVGLYGYHVNSVIQSNQLPQMVKVVQNPNQSVGQIKLKPNPVKIIKLPNTTEGNTQAPIYRTVKLAGIKCASKLVSELQQPETLAELNIIETLPNLVTLPVKPETSTSTNSKTTYFPTITTKRRKHADKVGKGLRHFSMKVCEKVRTKGFTSYNEVADELVLEFAAGMHGSADSQQYDQKNIRRRVYDALNVLMAMNIISKEKKEIRWLGLPTNSVQECTALEKEKQAKLEKIQKKTQQLQELILQHISFKSLIDRNKEAESKGLKPSPSSAIHLPFIVVNTSDKALIDCSISNDKTEYMFHFNKRFQIHDDIDILKRMGLLYEMGRGVSSKLSSMLEEEELDDTVEDDEAGEGEGEGECEEEAAAGAEGEEAPEYSDDSSDVDVTCAEEKEQVVLQMGTCDAGRALKVAKMVENDVAAVDINMGCPKEFSIKGGMGVALMGQPDKAWNILNTLVTNLSINVSCKIRILNTPEETLELVNKLVSSGIKAIGIHGRTKDERPQHAVNTDIIRYVAERISIPVIANTIWDLGEYCQKKQSEYQKMGIKGRWQVTPDELEPPYKKTKLGDTNLEEVNQLKACFIRGNFNDLNLPKARLHAWCGKNGHDLPVYDTRQVSKLFQTILTFNGKKYTSSFWEKNKKFAEQGAALVCLFFLGLVTEDELLQLGSIIK
ncbi:hypothetical protein MSG28_002202 [Choristoneura fumiferana]|uniref:Uncharacterized protein n=1 Tax=Choristoneura fumiferana TaxID=7141 RepID=A0ACC0JUJ7_CHOFU|nr:hypothetical protein MSG28_002202 [Choristoneura fumiferana]